MDRAWLSQLTERLRMEVLMPCIAEFRTKLEELRDQPLESFLEVLSPLFTEARLEFKALLESPLNKQLAPEFNQLFYGYLVSDFNSVMPEDYPYILGIGNIKDEGRMCFVYLDRRTIIKLYPNITTSAIPIVFVETSEDLGTGNFTSTDIAYHPDDIRIVPLEDQ